MTENVREIQRGQTRMENSRDRGNIGHTAQNEDNTKTKNKNTTTQKTKKIRLKTLGEPM